MFPTSETKITNGGFVSRSVRRAVLLVALVAALSFSGAALAWANGTAQTLPFSQNWTTTSQISSDNN